ncbi:MAG: DUF1844 domain-containing protein [Thermodesulfobacteriota bacterium]|jgi:hypothetical protein
MGDENGKCSECPPGQVRQGGRCVLPEPTFTTFIMSLNTSALFHLGELVDPETGQKGTDLVLAKHTIDTLQLLKVKTAGNLTDKEKELLENVLYDLQMRYVKATR